MLVLDDLRFACETCIRGHRSAQCSHSTRTLFEVRRKGRPKGSLKADSAPVIVHQPVTVTLPSGQAITANSPHSADRIRAALVGEARALQVVVGKAALDAHLRDFLQGQAAQGQPSPQTPFEQPVHQRITQPSPPPVQAPFIPDHLLPARLELLSVAALLNPCTCESRTGRRCLCCAAGDDGDSAACDSAACACHHGSSLSSPCTSPPAANGSAPGSCCSGGSAQVRATPDPSIAALLPDADLMALSPLLAPVVVPNATGGCGCAPTPKSPPPARNGCCAPVPVSILPPPQSVIPSAPILADPLWSAVAPLVPLVPTLPPPRPPAPVAGCGCGCNGPSTAAPGATATAVAWSAGTSSMTNGTTNSAACCGGACADRTSSSTTSSKRVLWPHGAANHNCVSLLQQPHCTGAVSLLLGPRARADGADRMLLRALSHVLLHLHVVHWLHVRLHRHLLVPRRLLLARAKTQARN